MSTPGFAPSTPNHKHVSFINLDDLVPRTDLAYAEWVAKALAEVYNVQNMNSQVDMPTRIGSVPPQSLFPGGELVLFHRGIAAQISHEYLAGSLFLTTENHEMKKYVQRFKRLM
jgi:hypothetical protein